MIEKKDWESALKQFEAMLINAQVNIEAHKHMVEYCKEELKKFPEDDPMPKEVKEIIDITK